MLTLVRSLLNRILFGRAKSHWLSQAASAHAEPLADRSERKVTLDPEATALLEKQWGYLNLPSDASTLMEAVKLLKGSPRLVLGELGVAEAKTSNRLMEYAHAIGRQDARYICVDTLAYLKHEPKLEFQDAMRFVNGGAERLAEFEFDFCFIDACHCAECVASDAIAASKSVRVGGLLAFHDTSLAAQYPASGIARREWQHYGCPEGRRPLAVVEGIAQSRASWHGTWKLRLQSGDHLTWGGVRVYERLS